MTEHVTSRRTLGFFFLGIASMLVAILIGGFLYLKYGDSPVATADPSFPMEAQIVHVPLEAKLFTAPRAAPADVNAASKKTPKTAAKKSAKRRA